MTYFRQRRERTETRSQRDHELSSHHISAIEPSTRHSVAPSVKSDDIYNDICEAEIQGQVVTSTGEVVIHGQVTSGGDETNNDNGEEGNDVIYVNETQTEEGYERLRVRYE